MKLAIQIKLDDKGNCAEDPRLSHKKWIVGSVIISVIPCGSYDFVTNDPPSIEIHGSTKFNFDSPKFDLSEFENAMTAARIHAASMHEAIKEHLRQLASERLY